jgi:hypothetical protein
MNPQHSIPLLLYYLFFGTTAVVTTIKFVLDKEWKNLTPKRLLWGWKALLLTVIPLTGLILAGKLGENMEVVSAAPYFAGAAFLSYILSQVGLKAELRALILLMLSVVLTMVLPTTGDGVIWTQPILGALGGLLSWKLVENLLHKPESRLDDLLAPAVWLGTFYYSKLNMGAVGQFSTQGLVLATMTVAVFLRWVQPVLLPRDTVYLKRLMMSLTGGGLLLVLINRVLLAPDSNNVAWLGAAGFLGMYLLQSLDRNVDDAPNLARGLKNILLVGIYTLAATRIFGMEGLLVLAATTVLTPIPGSALVAGFFWLSRVLLEGYVLLYDPNVTGINLMHAYTNAGLYAGFLAMVVASLMIKDLKDRRLLATLCLAGIVLLVGASNYFLHSEPAGAVLCSISVGAVLMSLLAPAFYPGNAGDQENLILMPMLGCVTALMSHELIELGDGADTEARVKAMCAIGFVLLCIALVNHFVFADRKGDGKKPVSAPDITS